MFERLVVGVDPGMAATGLAVVARDGRTVRVIAATTVRTASGVPEAERLRAVHDAVDSVLAEHGPEAVALERLLWGRNVGSAMSVARASGVVMLAAASRGVPVHEYAPLEVKLAVAGDGAAGKQQVRRALERLHRIGGLPNEADATDAVAAALCHLQQSPALRGAAR